MGTLHLYFAGICTHVKAQKPGEPHRVIVLNTRNGDPQHDIRPHQPFFLSKGLPAKAGPTFDGETITVRDVTGPLRYEPSYDRMPSLSSVAKRPIELDEDLLRHPNRERIAAIFEIPGGVWRVGIYGASYSGWVEITTTTDQPVLHIEPFDGGDARDVVLRNQNALVKNVAPDEKEDRRQDFLLHYRATRNRLKPEELTLPALDPEGTDKIPSLKLPMTTVGPGCSNSNYP